MISIGKSELVRSLTQRAHMANRGIGQKTFRGLFPIPRISASVCTAQSAENGAGFGKTTLSVNLSHNTYRCGDVSFQPFRPG